MTADAMLENPAVRARITRFTVEQYHTLGEYSPSGRRTELIRGYVFDKMSKSPLHASTGTHLYDLLFSLLPPGFWIRKEDPLTFEDSEPEPDISIVRGRRLDFGDHHPKTAALVAEVAISTVVEGRALASVYAEAGVEEYWIVLPRERQVEVYRSPAGGIYQERSMAGGDTVLACASIRGVQVDLRGLFET